MAQPKQINMQWSACTSNKSSNKAIYKMRLDPPKFSMIKHSHNSLTDKPKSHKCHSMQRMKSKLPKLLFLGLKILITATI